MSVKNPSHATVPLKQGYLDAEFRRVWSGLGELAGALEEGGAEARDDPRLLPATHHRVGLTRPSLPVGKQAGIVPYTS
jgi:hypothetical protein